LIGDFELIAVSKIDRLLQCPDENAIQRRKLHQFDTENPGLKRQTEARLRTELPSASPLEDGT
jgi:hypothetical protein